jgi:hypothetical protein
LCANSFAHENKIITLEEGKLIGLPDQFAPAEFNLDNFKLRIGDNEMAFTPFLASLFPENNEYDLDIYSSWYHDKSVSPSYIGFRIKPKEKDFSYKFSFNMDTLELLDVEVILKESPSCNRYLEIKIPGSHGTVTTLK